MYGRTQWDRLAAQERRAYLPCAQVVTMLHTEPLKLDGEAVLMGQVAMKNILQVRASMH